MRAIALLAIVTMTLSAQPPPVKDDWDCVIRRGNPAVQMWRAIREELLGKSGDAYMAQLKTATFPTFPATILAVFRGQQNPTFLVSVDDGGSPDAIVRLTGPWNGPALQPGTVRSALSQPFVGDAALEPLDSATNLLKVLDALQPTGRAQFVDHQGQAIAW